MATTNWRLDPLTARDLLRTVKFCSTLEDLAVCESALGHYDPSSHSFGIVHRAIEERLDYLTERSEPPKGWIVWGNFGDGRWRAGFGLWIDRIAPQPTRALAVEAAWLWVASHGAQP
jgi:hypothetical protein